MSGRMNWGSNVGSQWCGTVALGIKKLRTLPTSFNQLISVPAQYCRAIAKLTEELDNALKNACSACRYKSV